MGVSRLCRMNGVIGGRGIQKINASLTDDVAHALSVPHQRLQRPCRTEGFDEE